MVLDRFKRIFEIFWDKNLWWVIRFLFCCIWPNGNYYEGEFKCNLINGYGEMHYTDGRVVKGQWKSDTLYGEWTLVNHEINDED